MDKLYKHILCDIIQVISFNSLSTLFTSDKYISQIVSRYKPTDVYSFRALMINRNIYYLKHHFNNSIDNIVRKICCKYDYDLNYINSLKKNALTKLFSVCNHSQKIKLITTFFKQYTDITISQYTWSGNIRSIKWLRKLGIDYDWSTFRYAAQFGDLDIMKWLLADGCKIGKSFSSAAEFGNLDNMKWLLANGCKFDTDTFYNAVIFGNLDNMKWLLDNGCPIDYVSDGSNSFCGYRVVYYAVNAGIENGSIENLEWLRKNGANCIEIHNGVLSRTGNKLVFEWLIKNGANIEYPYCFKSAIEYSNLDIIKYLYSEHHNEINDVLNDNSFKQQVYGYIDIGKYSYEVTEWILEHMRL